MLEQSFQHLEGRGFVREGRVWKDGLIEQLREILVAKPVTSTAMEEVAGKAQTVAELRDAVVGSSGDDDVDRDLNAQIGSLLSIRDNGRVQKALENGYVLCTARVPRQIVEGEQPKAKPARFVSSDANVIEQYAQVVLLDRAVKATKNAEARGEMAIRRVPELAGRRPALVRGYHEQLAIALPIPAGQ